ncbi:glycosyltransferase family 2 protein [Winogradskyella sp. DF17]|uniref:Glycosyltransferase family 2 protein n=1 Tax=Winogradskyella pelagia TaxID=2819984 RepID=A0ABS3T3G6_9FLAO|nr:glycosyltransferase family 2 protein [Winogradskyella sp. DF17]MBO3117290.1 glycosyltransferase family 2 protein [Winogradskyella sp. DF17]
MEFYIVIPAHNEEATLGLTLESLTKQTLTPKKVVVVDDNSSDKTSLVAQNYCERYNWITQVHNTSSDEHMPGSKIINAFYRGYNSLDNNYDVICKFDADLIFPSNYLERLVHHFKSNDKLGMASGFCYLRKNNTWNIEDLTRKDHIRGALKAYRKQCFIDIGKLKPSMGWDTVDELLAQYHGWEILTDDTLKVKHLKPTGKSYNKAAKYLQGEAMYKMRYGFWITLISAAKLAYKKGSFTYFKDYLKGYFTANNQGLEPLVSKEEGKFIRQLRWKGILEKIA